MSDGTPDTSSGGTPGKRKAGRPAFSELRQYAKGLGLTEDQAIQQLLAKVVASENPTATMQVVERLKPKPEGRFLRGNLGLSEATTAQEAMQCLQRALAKKQITIQEYVSLVKATSDAWRTAESVKFAERIDRISMAVQYLAQNLPGQTMERRKLLDAGELPRPRPTSAPGAPDEYPDDEGEDADA